MLGGHRQHLGVTALIQLVFFGGAGACLGVVLGLAATAVLYVPLPKRRAASDGGQDAPAADDRAPGRRELLWTIVPWAVVVVFSLALSVWSFTSATSSGGIQASASRLRRDPVGLLLYNIMESLQVPGGLLGMAALGWNDVRPPALVYMTAIGIAAFVLLSGLRSLSWRKVSRIAVTPALSSEPRIVVPSERMMPSSMTGWMPAQGSTQSI